MVYRLIMTYFEFDRIGIWRGGEEAREVGVEVERRVRGAT